MFISFIMSSMVSSDNKFIEIGRLPMTTRVYDIRGWKLAKVSDETILFRPGQKVLLRRLGATVFAIGVALLLLWAYSSSFDFVRIGQYTVNLQSLLLFLIGVLIALGALAPISCLWNCLRIERTPRRDISIYRMGIVLPSWREWPAGTFQNIAPGAKEVLRSSRYEKHFIWWFTVNLMPAMSGETKIEFRLVEETQGGQLYFPKVVREVGAALSRLTGIPATGFDAKMPLGSMEHNQVHIVQSMPQKKKRVFTSLEEVPPELRARIEQFKAGVEINGKSGLFSTASEKITITQNGETHTYHSIDEMPPEVRARYEQIKKMTAGGPVPPGVTIRTKNISVEDVNQWET